MKAHMGRRRYAPRIFNLSTGVAEWLVSHCGLLFIGQVVLLIHLLCPPTIIPV